MAGQSAACLARDALRAERSARATPPRLQAGGSHAVAWRGPRRDGRAGPGGARQYLVIERYDRVINGQTVTLIHQEDAAQALGLDWVDDHAKFQDPGVPPGSHRPSAYRIAEFLGSLQEEGRPVADFLRRLTFTVLLGDNDAHAKRRGSDRAAGWR